MLIPVQRKERGRKGEPKGKARLWRAFDSRVGIGVTGNWELGMESGEVLICLDRLKM